MELPFLSDLMTPLITYSVNQSLHFQSPVSPTMIILSNQSQWKLLMDQLETKWAFNVFSFSPWIMIIHQKFTSCSKQGDRKIVWIWICHQPNDCILTLSDFNVLTEFMNSISTFWWKLFSISFHDMYDSTRSVLCPFDDLLQNFSLCQCQNPMVIKHFYRCINF